jgi:hypothetical protein
MMPSSRAHTHTHTHTHTHAHTHTHTHTPVKDAASLLSASVAAYKFSKVSALVHVLHIITTGSTF